MGLGDSISSPKTINEEMCVADCTHVAMEEPHLPGKHEGFSVIQETAGSSDMDLDCKELVSHLKHVIDHS